MDNESMQEQEAGRVALQRQARAYRSAGNFAAVETLLQEYRDLGTQGQLAPTAQLELEIQEYWTAEALAAYGTDEDAADATDALRKALTYFTPPAQLPALFTTSPEQWPTQIDDRKRAFVEQQLAAARTAADQTRQALWLAELGDMVCDQGDLAVAQQHLDEALTLAPEQAHLWAYRGEIQRQRQQYAPALDDFTQAITLDDQNAWAIASRGQVYFALYREDEAFADFDRALALDPMLAWALAGRGECYRLLKRYPEALADFNRAVALDGEDSWTITQRGQTYVWLGDYEKALADFTHALELDGEHRDALLARGEVYLLQEAFDHAFADFDQVLTLEPQQAWASGRRSLIQRRLGRYEPASADIEQALKSERHPQQSSWYLYCRGLIRLRRGQSNPASKDFNQALKVAAAIYTQDKTSVTNQFNLILYALAAQRKVEVAQHLPQLLAKIDSRHFLNMALFLVGDLLTVMPNQAQAIAMRQQLQKVEQRFVTP